MSSKTRTTGCCSAIASKRCRQAANASICESATTSSSAWRPTSGRRCCASPAASVASEESAVAQRFNKEVVVVSTIVSVATAYFLVLESQDRLRIARSNLAAADRILTLIKQRFAAGTASQLDVAQQESLVGIVRASIPPLDLTLRQNIATLAILIGRAPE